jgi:hypothetical protein
VPLFYPVGGGTNRAVECLGEAKLRTYVGVVFLLCAASWLFHALYYKYMGHPWSDINGPDFSRSHFGFNFHFCGKERRFDWRFFDKSGDIEGERGKVCCAGKCWASCREVPPADAEAAEHLMVKS